MPKGQNSKNARKLARRLRQGRGTSVATPLSMGNDLMNFLSNTDKCIISMAKEYNFYPQDIMGFILRKNTIKFGLHNRGLVPVSEVICDDDDNIQGFLCQTWATSSPNACMVEFFFLKPEYRRKGIFTRYIEQIKKWDEVKTININTDTPEMIRALDKLGFKYQRKCDNGIELYFRWTK